MTMFYKSTDENYRTALEGVDFKTLAHGERTSLGEFRIAKGAVIPMHSHPHEQTGYLVSGRMTFNIAGEIFDAEAGDAWNIPSNVEHGVDAHEDCVVIEVFSPVREDYL